MVRKKRGKLRKIFEACAVSAGISATAAASLPVMDLPGSPAFPGNDNRTRFSQKDLPFRNDPGVSIREDGTLIMNGMVGTPLDVYFSLSDSVFQGPRTAVIYMHGGGSSGYFSLSTEWGSESRLTTARVIDNLTAYNPETIIIFSCNREGGGVPSFIDSWVGRPDSALKRVIMTAPGHIAISVSEFAPRVEKLSDGTESKLQKLGITLLEAIALGFDMVYSNENPVGRTIAGNSYDRGLLYPVFIAVKNDENDKVGPLMLYERGEGGEWINRGPYKLDNLYDLIDLTPVGWITDSFNIWSRGLDKAYDDLRLINDQDNNLTYEEKVKRNLARPAASIIMAVHTLLKQRPENPAEDKRLDNSASQPRPK